ncbi:sugar phosphate isomerase/epimerase family protein [Acidisoma sp.]|uniref:sugar phosphate isomerase/epimerase family protein n=1 Tax=Acidisoma sp. TaxID=1872115 RepID=UPI003B002778
MKLEVFQALWAMQQRRPGVPERPVEESFEMIAAAGYDGVGIDLGVTPLEEAQALGPLLQRYNLGCLVTAFVKTMDGLGPVLDLARRLDARHVNLIGQVMPLNVEATVPVARRWMEMAEAAGVSLQFETHRNSITNDMFATLQLLDAVPEMVISADLSHYVVGREFDCPPDARTEGHVARLLARSGSFQGRIASRQQIQVPFGFPQYAKWLGVFLAWWEAGFRQWRRHGSCGSTTGVLNFLCELGPHEYAMTGPDGCELSDRWEEALILKAHARRLWSALETE